MDPYTIHIPAEFTSFLQGVERTARAPKIGTEAHFATLDVQEGDRVRLTELRPQSSYLRDEQRRKPDAAVLEGAVLGVKRKPEQPSQLRISGFDHTGGNAGGQHVWFPVNNYLVEVLHRVFRMTDEDRVLIAITGDTEAYWKSLSDAARQRQRETYATRVARVKRALGVDDE